MDFDFLYAVAVLVITGGIFLGIGYFLVKSLIDYAIKKNKEK